MHAWWCIFIFSLVCIHRRYYCNLLPDETHFCFAQKKWYPLSTCFLNFSHWSLQFDSATSNAYHVWRGFRRKHSRIILHTCSACKRLGVDVRKELAVAVFRSKQFSFLRARKWCRWTAITIVKPIKKYLKSVCLLIVLQALGRFGPIVAFEERLNEQHRVEKVREKAPARETGFGYNMATCFQEETKPLKAGQNLHCHKRSVLRTSERTLKRIPCPALWRIQRRYLKWEKNVVNEPYVSIDN